MNAIFSRGLTISMTKKQAQKAEHSGRCDGDVEALRRTPKMQKQLRRITDQELINELNEHGAWSAEDLKDRQANECRVIWLAAGMINDENS